MTEKTYSVDTLYEYGDTLEAFAFESDSYDDCVDYINDNNIEFARIYEHYIDDDDYEVDNEVAFISHYLLIK